MEHLKRANAGPETLHKLLVTNYEQNKLVQTAIAKKNTKSKPKPIPPIRQHYVTESIQMLQRETC